MMSILNSITEAASGAAPPMAKSTKSYPARPRKVAPLHPGRVIGGILEDQKVSLRAAAAAIGVTPMALGNVINGKSAITPEMALRLGIYLWNGPDLWLNLQREYDLWHASKRLEEELKKIKPMVERKDDAA